MRSFGLLVAAALLLPGAAAERPVCEDVTEVEVCVEEDEWGDPDCEKPSSSGAGITWVRVVSEQAGVVAGGWTACARGGSSENRAHGVFAYGYANAGAFSVTWYQSQRTNGEQCTMRTVVWTVAGETPVATQCVVPPPNPGWGGLIP